MLAHVAARWWKVHPTAISRNTPSFFLRATKDAPNKNGRTMTGVFPERTRFVSAERLRRRGTPPRPAVELVRSNRCWGRRQSGPPAEPLGNERIACLMSHSLNINSHVITNFSIQCTTKIITWNHEHVWIACRSLKNDLQHLFLLCVYLIVFIKQHQLLVNA